MISFKDMALNSAIQQALEKLNFTTPTEIQQEAIPKLLAVERADFHGQAQTGTGKTLAFGLPLLEKIDISKKPVQALIVAPTRELVVQICDSLKSVAQNTRIVIEPIYGGVSMQAQMRALKQGIHIVIGTPGRLNDHLRRGTLSLQSAHTLVLDEADIMLDMGFREEVEEILTNMPKDRQIWLFSATVKDGVKDIKRKHMHSPIEVNISPKNLTTANTKQYYCLAPMRVRLQALCRFVDMDQEFYGVVFCQTKLLASEIADKLSGRGYSVGALHGDMNQAMRNNVIKKFKSGDFTILVATDVAARGLDIADLTHVINYSLPEDHDSYVHRIGRTGRAGKQGTAITFIGKGEANRMGWLAKKFNTTIEPLDVPKVTDIVGELVKRAITYVRERSEKVSSLVAADKTSSASHDKLREAIAGYTHQELTDGMVALLADKFLQDYSRQDDSIVSSTSSISSDDNRSETVQEIMLSVGLDDGLTRDSVQDFCVATGQATENEIEKIRVIKRRTFITASPDVMNRLVNAMKGQKLGGFSVRAVIITAQAQGGSSHGGGDRRSSGGDRGGRSSGRSSQGGGRSRGGSSSRGGYGNDRSGSYSSSSSSSRSRGSSAERR